MRDNRWLSGACVAFLVAGGLTWRVRGASAIADSPVDGAATLRLILDTLAGSIAAVGLQGGSGDRSQRYPAGTVSLYSFYVIAVVIGLLVARQPALVGFRFAELVVTMLVAVYMARWWDLRGMVQFFRRLVTALALLAVVTALIVPSRGLFPTVGGILPFRLEGVYPIMSANTVGFLGVSLLALSLASARHRALGVAAGLSLVLLTQYRTGYVAVIACLLVYGLSQQSASRRAIWVLAIPLAGIWLAQGTLLESAWTRGARGVASTSTLSGRTEWWSAALEAVERSPIIGLGLSSGTRMEVLPSLRYEDTSTIHGTWVEAYVGTGLVGAFCLLMFAIWAVRVSWRAREVSLGPLLFVVTMLVRSITGTTIELASLTLLMVLALVITAERQVSLASRSGDLSVHERSALVTSA